MTQTDPRTLEEALEYLERSEFMPIPATVILVELAAQLGVDLLIEAIRHLDEERKRAEES